MLNIKDFVPDFSAKNQFGERIKFSNYKGKKVIIFFYPKANTPGCTAESCSFRDGYSTLQKAGFELLGISADSVEKQLQFSQKNNLPFFLLSDEDKSICNIFGVWGKKKFMGKEYEGILRTTFIIDENQHITHRIDKVKTKEATEQVLRILDL
ncbi:MAG: thioredoxin-dependent thiol peroxidase [Capnocytophaga sp.]|nr:thioredoxin-dependent thiol peroxidase [Capnocytophaga sp.]